MQIRPERFLTLAALVASAAALVVVGCSTKKDAPSGAGTASTGTTTLTWSANTESDLNGYRVYVGTASGTFGLPISTVNTTVYQVTNLTVGQTYYFAVTAVDSSNNESGFSDQVSKIIAGAAQDVSLARIIHEGS